MKDKQFILLLVFILMTGIIMVVPVKADNTTIVIIEANPGGSTYPMAGNYSYLQTTNILTIYAYPHDGWYISGWIINGVFHGGDVEYSQVYLNNPENITFTFRPVFTQNPQYTLTLSSNMTLYPFYVNHVAYSADSTPENISIAGGTQVTLQFGSYGFGDNAYIFSSYLKDGSAVITEPDYVFVMNGDTSIVVRTTTTTKIPLTPLFLLIPPGIIIGALGLSFSLIGERLDNHVYAGFLIGGSIGLIICTNTGMIPMWFTTATIMIGLVAMYFWFRSN